MHQAFLVCDLYQNIVSSLEGNEKDGLEYEEVEKQDLINTPNIQRHCCWPRCKCSLQYNYLEVN